MRKFLKAIVLGGILSFGGCAGNGEYERSALDRDKKFIESFQRCLKNPSLARQGEDYFNSLQEKTPNIVLVNLGTNFPRLDKMDSRLRSELHQLFYQNPKCVKYANYINPVRFMGF